MVLIPPFTRNRLIRADSNNASACTQADRWLALTISVATHLVRLLLWLLVQLHPPIVLNQVQRESLVWIDRGQR